MKKKLSLTALLLLAASLCHPVEINFDFHKESTEIFFSGARILTVTADPGGSLLLVTLDKSLKSGSKKVDYRFIKTISFQGREVTLRLRLGRNYAYAADRLTIYTAFPQEAYAKSDIVKVYSGPGLKSGLETEMLLGTRCTILKNDKGWMKIEIPDQGGHGGWVTEGSLDLFIDRNSSYPLYITDNRSVLLTGHSKVRLEPGTPYRLLEERGEDLLIELGNGMRGNIKRQDQRGGDLGMSVVESARSLMGIPYVWGGTSERGLDCSGLTYLAYKMNGINLPRDGFPQYKSNTKIKKSELRPGDLVFFQTFKKGPSHVGIYSGSGRFIHASSSKGVTESSLSEPYFKNRYYGAVRVSQ